MKNYSKIHDTLIENITEYPTNIAAALRLTARQTKSTYFMVKNYYYRHMRNSTPLFIIRTTKGISINGKVQAAKKETARTLQLKDSLISLGTLSREDKADFFDILLGL